MPLGGLKALAGGLNTRPVRNLAAHIVGYYLDEPIGGPAGHTTRRDIVEDVDCDDNHGDAPTAQQDAESSGAAPTWSELGDYIHKLTSTRLYPPVIACFGIALFVISLKQAWEGEPMSFPIVTGAAATIPLLGVVRFMHVFGPLSSAAKVLLGVASAVITTGAYLETDRQLRTLASLDQPPIARSLCLLIPTGMLILASVLAFTIKIGRTTGQIRGWAAPGWVAVALGCVATFATTGRHANLVLAGGAFLAAIIAVSGHNADQP